MLCKPLIITCSVLFLIGLAVSGQSAPAGNQQQRAYFNDAVSAISVSNDMKYLAAGRGDDVVFVWNLKTRGLLRRFDIFPYQSQAVSGVPSVYVSSQKNLLVVGLPDGSAVTFSLLTGKVVGQYRSKYTDWPPYAQLFDEGRMIALGTEEGQFTFTDIATGKETWSWHLPGHKNLEGAAVSPSGRLLAAWDASGSMFLLDIHSHKPILATKGVVLSGGLSGSDSVFDLSNTRYIYGESDMSCVRLWDSERGGRTDEMNTGFYNPRMAISPNGRLLAVCDESDYAKIWEINPDGTFGRVVHVLGRPPHIFDSDGGTICMIFSPDNRELLMGTGEGYVVAWSIKSGNTSTFAVGRLSLLNTAGPAARPQVVRSSR